MTLLFRSGLFFSDYLMARDRFFDDQLEDYFRSGDVAQLVIVGAGNDMRSVRLAWMKTIHVFELDFPDRIAAKRSILMEARGVLPDNVIYIGADVSRTALCRRLERRGFLPRQPAAFLIQGLIYYMSPEGIEHLFNELGRLMCPGSLLLIDQISDDIATKKLFPEDLSVYCLHENPRLWRGIHEEVTIRALACRRENALSGPFQAARYACGY